MFIWGGKDNQDVLDSGAKYNVSSNSWTPLYDGGSPTPRCDYGITWTGTEVIVFGGYFPPACYDNGKKYTLSNDTWSSIADSTGTLEGRALPAFHYWPSKQSIIVWGGYGDNWVNLGDGAIYDISSNSWTYINPNDDTDTPSPRSYFATSWDPTSEKMYIWGGYIDAEPYYANDGAIYDPANSQDPWQPIAIDANTPSERAMVSGVWTGSKFIVWGGENVDWETINTGGIYDPSSQSWTPTSLTNAPSPRAIHLAKYIDTGMAIWGGDNYTQALNDGGILNSSNQWSSFPLQNAPEARAWHSGDWNGRDLFIWGGSNNYDNVYFNNGARYDLSNFTSVSTNGAPRAKTNFEIIWTDGYFFVWGGIVPNGYTNIGALYCSCLNAPPQATNPSPSNGGKACDTSPVNLSCDNAEANLFDISIDNILECENVSSCSCSKSLTIGSHTWSVVSENHCGTASGSPPVWTFDVITTPNSASNPDPANGSYKCSSSPITASWSAGTYAEQYDVYLNSNLVSSCENISETTCNFGLLSGGDYSWYVISENICGSEQSPTWNFSIDTTVPASASNPDPANGSIVCPDPDLSWSSASGARTYDVYYDTNKICSDITNTSCDPGTVSSGSHSWYVLSINKCGSTQTGPFYFTILQTPSQPTVQDKDVCQLNGVNIFWESVDGATGYDLSVDGSTIIQNVTSPYTYEPGDSNSHSYQIRAKNAICTTSWSSQTSGTDENNTPTPTISGDFQNLGY